MLWKCINTRNTQRTRVQHVHARALVHTLTYTHTKPCVHAHPHIRTHARIDKQLRELQTLRQNDFVHDAARVAKEIDALLDSSQHTYSAEHMAEVCLQAYDSHTRGVYMRNMLAHTIQRAHPQLQCISTGHSQKMHGYIALIELHPRLLTGRGGIHLSENDAESGVLKRIDPYALRRTHIHTHPPVRALTHTHSCGKPHKKTLLTSKSPTSTETWPSARESSDARIPTTGCTSTTPM